MNAVQLFQPSTSSMKLSSTDKLVYDLIAIADDEFWSDIEVKVQGKSFPCHRNILAARSSYFNETLRRSRHLTVIVEEDGTSDAFEFVRRYIYTGTVDHNQATEGTIANVLSLSIKYKLKELTNFMSDQMRKRIAPENAVKVFRLVSNMKMNSIADICLEFIRNHADDCLQTASFLELRMSQLIRLLKNTRLDDATQFMLIRKWMKIRPEVNAAKLFRILDGEIDYEEDDGNDDRRGKQYVLLHGCDGEMVVLDADTFDEVSRRRDPTTTSCRIAVCKEMLYVIDTTMGEIKTTPVSSLLKSQSIQWAKCASCETSTWSPGNVAVVGLVIYYMSKTHIWKFDTATKSVTRLHRFDSNFLYYSLVELNGLIYCYKGNILQFTDEINEWKQIDLPASLGQYPFGSSLIKVQDSVFVVGGMNDRGDYVSSMLCYDTKSLSWTKGKAMNKAGYASGTVTLDGAKTLLVGGHNDNWTDTIELFDEQTKAWSVIDYKVKLEYPQAVKFYA